MTVTSKIKASPYRKWDRKAYKTSSNLRKLQIQLFR